MSKPVITDHALLRYIERVCDVDIDQLRKLIMTDELKAAIKLKASALRTQHCTYVIKDGAVVTVLSPDMPTFKENRNLTWIGVHPEQSL